jgi:hypothetical protein
MPILKQMAVLMFYFPHNFLNNLKNTILPQVFILSVNKSWLVKLFLYFP